MTFKPEIILCEGESELAYIQELNRLLVKNNTSYGRAFIPKCIGSGYFNLVKKAYIAERKRNPKDTIFIWVDKDLYVRNDKNCLDEYKKRPNSLPEFFFSIMNFEDFIVLHCQDEIVSQWIDFCTQKRHFSSPMHASEYEPFIKKMFPDYQKGELPFNLTSEHVRQMMKNLHKYQIDNDFGEHISQEIQQGNLKFLS